MVRPDVDDPDINNDPVMFTGPINSVEPDIIEDPVSVPSHEPVFIPVKDEPSPTK